MAPKKKLTQDVPQKVTPPLQRQKTQQQVKLESYYNRWKEAELYLKLLSTSLLEKIVGVQVGPNASDITDKVELELKEFIGQRLEELLGLNVNTEGFAKNEVQALKLLANKITNKTPEASPVVVSGTQNINPQVQSTVSDETLAEEQSGVTQVVAEGVYARSVNVINKDGTQTPLITGPTDKLKKVKSKTLPPAPPISSAQEQMLAQQQAMAFQQTMSSMTGQSVPTAVLQPASSNENKNVDFDNFESRY